MERTNLNFSTVKTNLDDKNNLLVKNNFIDTNNYVKQNMYTNSVHTQNSQNTELQQSSDFVTNVRSKPLDNSSMNLNDYSRKKIIPITNNNEKFKITRLNIDSRYREQQPKNILNYGQHILPENPLFFQANSNILTIYDPNHGYNYDDKIILQNLTINTDTVRIVFEKNNYFVRVEYNNHNLNPSYNYILLISNFIGNSQNNTMFDNIPINYLNKIQNIYFSNGSDTANPNYFYIKINILPSNNNDSLVDTKLFSLNGVPINNINSNYPININQLQSSLTISNIISKDYYQVTLSLAATIGIKNINGLSDNTSLRSLQNNIGTGGSDIMISQIVDVIEGFPDSNNFKYNLGKNFKHVNKIRLLSSEIPSTEKIIKSYPKTKQNNKLYWQNVADGDTIYDISITPGNYSTTDLASQIQQEVLKVPKNNTAGNVNTSKIIYLNDHFVTVSIAQNTNTFDISYYTTVILTKAIVKSTYTYADGFTRIIVTCPNHNLNNNDTILIQNAVTTEKIPDTALNGQFTVESVIDPDNIQIKLDKYNLDTSVVATGGGDAIKLLIPLQTRLLFNLPGTIGNILGFRNVGDYNAVTIYSKALSNVSEYELDSNLNSVGINTSDIVSKTVLNFNGYSYIYLCVNYIFKDSVDINGVKNIFAKLNLSSGSNTITYNDFIQIGQEFLDPIISLSELQFSFYTPDGLLYDFNNINVSFTIEIFEEINFKS